MTDEYALLIAFVEHAESGAADYELGLDQHHYDRASELSGCAVYLDGELKFVVPHQDISSCLISPYRLKTFEMNHFRRENRKTCRLEDEPME